MPKSGNLLLCNNTPDQWVLDGPSVTSSGMSVWDFPHLILPKTCPVIFIQFRTDGDLGQLQGEATYDMSSGKIFKIQAQAQDGFHVQVEQLNWGLPPGLVWNLGWQDDPGYVGIAFGPDYSESPAGF